MDRIWGFKKKSIPQPQPEYQDFKCECGCEWFAPVHGARQNTETGELRQSRAYMRCVNCGVIYHPIAGDKVD